MNPSSSEDLRLVERIRWLRTLGLGLGFLCPAAVFYERGAHPLLWAVLAFDGFIWPQLAWLVARRSSNPHQAEFRNLLIDSVAGGVWVALMHFSLLPSLLFITMLSMDKIAVGGWPFLARTASAQALACLVAGAFAGFRFEPASSTLVTIASAPFLMAYPVAVATTTHALARRVRRQNKLLAELNRVDALSGLLNRSHWEEAVSGELRRHQRLGRPAALLMLDIDRFKQINDQQGHPTGDEVIRGIGSVLRGCLRDIDVAGRYGGDEFGILLPDADLQQALAAAERIRRGVESAAYGPEGKQRGSVSIGLALAGSEIRDSRDWIGHADAALYRAKTCGRNRVEGPGLSLHHTG